MCPQSLALTEPANNTRSQRDHSGLKLALDRLLEKVDPAAAVARDPIRLVRRYSDPADQEVAGLLVSALAYGRASSIQAKAGALLERLGPPARAVDRGAVQALEGFVYRFQSGSDLPRFARAIGALRRRHGSLGAAFAAGVASDHFDYADAIDRFQGALREACEGELSPGLRFLMPLSPGGAAKRSCLYLRWMIRGPDGVDLGTWGSLCPGLSPARLVIPLDTHIQQLAGALGLTRRKSPNLKMAREITAALARLSPDDPLRYDLALCHLGISGACVHRRDEARCPACPIEALCTL